MKPEKGKINQSAPLTYSLKLRLNKESKFFGPGVAQLLCLVEETQSLNVASQTMEMAYSKAWRIIKIAEEALGYPLLVRKVGGMNGGGSIVTDKGKEFVRKFLILQEEAYQIVDVLFKKHFSQPS